MTTSRRLIAGLLVIAAAGCGHQAPLTKSSYLSRAEALCSSLESKGQALPNPSGPADLPAYLKASTELTVATQKKLVALTRDYSDRSYVNKIFLSPFAKQIATVQALMPKVAVESGRGRTDALDGLKLPQADLSAMGIYGFHECRKVVGTL